MNKTNQLLIGVTTRGELVRFQPVSLAQLRAIAENLARMVEHEMARAMLPATPTEDDDDSQ